MRKIMAFFLLATLSLSSVAMPVFTHVCNGMDQTWSSLFVPPGSCCAVSESKAGKCSANDTTENQDCQLSKLPCCENEVSLVALGATYTPEILAGIPFPSFVTILPTHSSLFGIKSYENTSLQTIALDHSPTPTCRRRLLMFAQLFICYIVVLTVIEYVL